MRAEQLTILGVGLLGGSIGLAARSRWPACRVVGYGHRRQTLDQALSMGAIQQAFDDAAKSVAGSDIVLLCTPVSLFEPILRQIAPALAPGCLVMDVGSTKRSVVKLAEAVLRDGVVFVASHPMAGGERRGIGAARADLLDHSLCLLTPTGKTSPAALARAEQFWQDLGMRTLRLDVAEHDRRLADVSHLPHLLAAALVAMQDEASLKLCGRGFLDATRIAAGDGALWRDILADNADNMKQSLDRLAAELDKVRAMLAPDQSEALRQWLDAAAQRRRAMNPPRD